MVALVAERVGNKVKLKWCRKKFNTDIKLHGYARDNLLLMDDSVLKETRNSVSFRQASHDDVLRAWESFECQPKLKARNKSKEVMDAKALGTAAKQRWYSNAVNTMLAMADKLVKTLDENQNAAMKTPIVFYGEGFQYSGKVSAWQYFRDYLARYFPVFIVSEYMTSQTCPHCLGKSKQVSSKSSRLYTCINSCRNYQDGQKQFRFNKDVSACICMAKGVLCQVYSMERPGNLRRKTKPKHEPNDETSSKRVKSN